MCNVNCSKIVCNDNKYIALKIRNASQIFVAENNKGFEPGSRICVMTERGKEIADVLSSCSDKVSPIGGKEDFLKKILDLVKDEELEKEQENFKKEKKALETFRKKVEKHELPMKVIEVYYMLDNSRIMFYYYAENKVDFRKLVRELAGIYKTRIEMRQVGIRDEAKIRGGLGPCGLITCCTRFLYDFESISMKMAKDQEIMLNPSKISGICGRLMCCLKYEQDAYNEYKDGLPENGSKVIFKGKKGKVINVNPMKKCVTMVFEGEKPKEYDSNFFKENIKKIKIINVEEKTGGVYSE